MKKVKGMRAKDMDKLIAAVQARECLWDKSCKDHRNRFKLERYWNEVAAELGISSLICRKRWKNYKCQYRKNMKKNPNESEWPHSQKLKFIHHQFLKMISEDEDSDDDTTEEVYRPKVGYTMRKKLLTKKRRTIDVDVNKLIDLVQKNDIIWNRQLKGRQDWYKLDERWKEIAQELDVTSDEARLRWRYLSDQTRKEYRKQGSQWEYLPKLQFLTKQFNGYEGNKPNDNDIADDQYSQDFDADQGSSYYLDPSPASEVSVKEDDFEEFDTKPIINDDEAQKSTGNGEMSEPAKDDDIADDQYSQDFDADQGSSYYLDPPPASEVSVKEDDFEEFDTKPIIMNTYFYDKDDEAQKSTGNGEMSEPAKDEDVGFFNSLLPHVRKLGPAKKLMLRMKIQELVYNTVYS